MAIRFDEASDRINHTSTPPPDPAAGLTITAWVYLSVDRDNFSTIARLSAASGASTSAGLATHGSGTTLGYLSPGGSLVSGHALTVGQWSRVAITCTGTTGTVYGAPATGAVSRVSGTVGGAASPTMLTVGGRSVGDASEWLNGRVAHLRVWSVALSQAEIEAEWASTTPVRTGGLWAAYPLPTAGDLTDHSGNGRHLTAGATPVTTEAGPPLTTPVALAGAVRAAAGATGAPQVVRHITGHTRSAGSSTAVVAVHRDVRGAAAEAEAARAVLTVTHPGGRDITVEVSAPRTRWTATQEPGRWVAGEATP